MQLIFFLKCELKSQGMKVKTVVNKRGTEQFDSPHAKLYKN